MVVGERMKFFTIHWYLLVSIILSNGGCFGGAIGRDITVSCPVEACGDGLNSGVVTITCVQTNVSMSSDGKDKLENGEQKKPTKIEKATPSKAMAKSKPIDIDDDEFWL